MEPITIVIIVLAALFIVGRGPLLVAPLATVEVYRRVFSSIGRTRAFGGLMILLAVALVVTARLARAEHGDITFFFEGTGWFVGAIGVFLLLAPRTIGLLVTAFWDAVSSSPVRRAIGAVNLAGGLVLGWVALVAF